MNFKSKKLAIAVAATLVAAAFMVPAWSDEPQTDSSMVKMQAGSMEAIKQAIVSAGGYEPANVEIKHTARLVTATIVDSKHNSESSEQREKAARDVASAIGKQVAGKPEFDEVGSVRVDYVNRGVLGNKKLQTFDFYRSPANVFTLHKS